MEWQVDPALAAALRSGQVGTAGDLLDRHPDWLTPALWPIAVYQGQSLDATRCLLLRGLDPNLCSAPRLPLHLAVYRVLPDIADALLAAGADATRLNSLGERPLDPLDAYESRRLGDTSVLRLRDLLVSHSAEYDMWAAIRLGDVVAARSHLGREPELLRAGSPGLGVPALHVAARSARPAATHLLLSRGADPNYTGGARDGNTALWFASQSCADADDRLAVIEVLLAAGAAVNARCEEGSTALHFAAWRGPAAIVSRLLEHHADQTARDDAGRRPLDYARESDVLPDGERVVALLSA